MKNHSKLRPALLVASLAAITATAWAASESAWVPAPADAPLVTTAERPVWNEVESRSTQAVLAPADVEETLAPNEVAVTDAETRAALAAEPRTRIVAEREEIAQPPITVEERRLTRDERIQADVMDRLANHPRLSGKIGVVSEDAKVTLTGYTITAAQASRAGMEARRVDGVRAVDNQIRPRIGGTV